MRIVALYFHFRITAEFLCQGYNIIFIGLKRSIIRLENKVI